MLRACRLVDTDRTAAFDTRLSRTSGSCFGHGDDRDQYDPSNDSTARIKQKLEAAWSVNAIDQVDSGSVRIERRRSGLKLMLQYEVRFPIVGDIVGVGV